jgi:hypothetical protein
VLAQPQTRRDEDPSPVFENETVLNEVYQMIGKALSRKKRSPEAAKERALGKGDGGLSGINNGIVLKRDSGTRVVGNYEDRYDGEPGGIFRPGDAELWIPWHGWSALVTRDGRWRPGYHLEILSCMVLCVLDWGPTRQVWRDRTVTWLAASEWTWKDTPPEIHRNFTAGMKNTFMEMLVRERQRLASLKPQRYVPDDNSTSARRYQNFLDRAGEISARHPVGEGLDTPRGLLAAWVVTCPNDIVDYERDVLHGEQNNFVRALTSNQQVVDTAWTLLESLRWSFDNKDYDMSDTILGSIALYLVYWRYNVGKIYGRYKPLSVRASNYSWPIELTEITDIMKPNSPQMGPNGATYGQFYEQIKQRVQEHYGGCTCLGKVDGHDAWELLSQAYDAGGNDEIEERLHVAMVALGGGANKGDLRSECGLDLVCYESFVRLLDPDWGIVARMHYRTSSENGNSLTE